MTQDVDYAVLIGRLQPFHMGHQDLIRKALRSKAEHVIVLIGSANTPRSFKNPWSFAERKRMITLSFTDQVEAKRIRIEPLPDVPGNDDLWLANARAAIAKHAGETDTIGLLGYKKDSSTYYLSLFPSTVDMTTNDSYGTLNATDIREGYFQKAPTFPHDLVPFQVYNWLVDWYRRSEFKYVLEEAEWKREYDASWANSPYPPTFVTCDAVMTQMGHVALVKRGGHPGKGLWALPGGYVDPSKGDSFENILHEITEETQIADQHGTIPRGKLRGFFTGEEKRFDDPDRSIRGYTLTTAFRFELPPAKKLFTLTGGDDADAAEWVPIEKVRHEDLTEDHYHILQSFDVV